MVPELIAYPAPVSYNSASYYLPVLFLYKDWGSNLITYLFYPPQFSPLVYLLMIPPTAVFDPRIVVAVSAAALYGILAFAVFHYLKNVAGLTELQSVLGTFFVVIQFSVLNLSLGSFSEILALSIGIITLSSIAQPFSWKKVPVMALLLVSTGLAHQMVLLTLLPCIVYLSILHWRKTASGETIKLLLSCIPAMAFLAWNWFLLQKAQTIFPAGAGVKVLYLASDTSSTGISPFANYFIKFGSYPLIVGTIIGFVLFLYAPLLPLLVLSRPTPAKPRPPSIGILSVWALMIAGITISPIVSPWFAVDLWYLWAVTVSVPLSMIVFKRYVRYLLLSRRKKIGTILILTLIPYTIVGAGYMTQPPDRPFIYFSGSPFVPYMASSMLANTMPLKDSIDTSMLLEQLNSTLNHDALLLVHEAFYGFAAIAITGQEKNILNYQLGNVMSAVSYAEQLGFSKIYWIWWLPGYGWHGLVNPPTGFTIIRQKGHMAIYLFTG